MNARPRRRQPRVQYRAPLRIRQASEESALEATALDLSQGGVGVRASGAYPVGSNVVCELEVQGTQLALPGVVAWAIEPEVPAERARRETRNLFRLGSEAAEAAGTSSAAPEPEPEPESEPEPSGRPDTKTLIRLGAEPALGEAARADAEAEPAAMGICFETLLEDQVRLLGALLREGTPASSRVELRFSGLADPIAARAEASSEGLLLRTGLPFLALDSEVRFRFAGEDDEQTGRVVRVELETQNRVPRLRVDIAERAAEERLRERRRTPIPPAPKPSSGRKRAAFAGLLLGAVLGASGTLFALKDRDAAAALLRSALVPSRGQRSAQAKPAQIASPVAAPPPSTTEQQLVEAAQRLGPATPGAALAPPQSAPPDPAIRVAAAAGAQPLPGPEPPAPEPPPEPEPAAAQPAAGATAGEPEVTTIGLETRVFVPMQGTDADISRYELSSPGLVVSLPHAVPSIPLADYAIYRGVVRRVWLRPFHDGVQVRVVWRRPPLHSKVVWDERGLTLVFRG